MFLFGCTVGPDFNPPVVKTPETYRFGTGEGARAVNLKWWDLFNDPDLYTLVTMALENNRDHQDRRQQDLGSPRSPGLHPRRTSTPP